MKHRFNYNWTLKDAVFTKDKGKVFSCFSCGGGSTMGYKLAGFDVIGCNEIDPKMMECYIANHQPKYSYLEPIQTFKDRKDLPKELYELDILDGSPPCSSFSMAGNREKDWGKEKVFREGQAEQVLDTLFFDFIDLAKELQPKVVVAENVKGLLLGEATKYVAKIYEEFENAGYYIQHFLLDASKMGVPQRRERVFFIGLRKDLATPFLVQHGFFEQRPVLILDFNEPKIKFMEIEETKGVGIRRLFPSIKNMWEKTKEGQTMIRRSGSTAIGHYKINKNNVLNTVIAHTKGSGGYHYSCFRSMSKLEFTFAGAFPKDYNFLNIDIQYLIGMSVPPVMTAQIATELYSQWLSKI
jgi:DNA (cytosine-5)-methyltransferase 1